MQKDRRQVSKALPLRARLLRFLATGRSNLGRKLILKAVRRYRDAAPDAEFEIDFFNMRYAGHLGRHIDYDVYMLGAFSAWELHVIDCVGKIEGGRRCALDIGANAGHHAMFMSGIFERVVAFEPYHENFERLLATKARNGLGNIACHSFGLGNQETLLPFTPPTERNEGVGSFRDSASPLRLETKLGDAFIEREGIEAVDFIKIDVEGFEAEVLQGLRHSLERFRPVLLVESEKERWEEARRHLYAGHRIFGVKSMPDKRSARLVPQGLKCIELLVLPEEKADEFLAIFENSRSWRAVGPVPARL